MTFDTRDTPYQVSAADLEQLGSLGRGQYGQVDRVRHKESGFEFAVKVCEFWSRRWNWYMPGRLKNSMWRIL